MINHALNQAWFILFIYIFITMYDAFIFISNSKIIKLIIIQNCFVEIISHKL
jgi:hypothetical protein